MPYYAQIDVNSRVSSVIVADFSHICTISGIWIPASDDKSINGNYPGIGYTWFPSWNTFMPPKPYASWNFDAETLTWKCPVDYPDDGRRYVWREEGQYWEEYE